MLEFEIDQEKCIQCGECVRDCPYGIIELIGDSPALVEDRIDQCIRCQHCLAVCPTAALSILGKDPQKSIEIKGNLPTADQLETLVKARRSIRFYKKKPVDPGTIAHLLDVVAHCPTGVNNRQLLFTIVEDQKSMEKLRQETYEGIRKVAQNDALPKGLEFFGGILGAWDKGQDIIYRGAPHFLVVSSPEGGPSPQADTIIALSYFELVAYSIGLGTVWDGLAKWALTAIVPDMITKLGVPKDHLIGYMMVFGWPAIKHHRTVQRGDAQVNRVRL